MTTKYIYILNETEKHIIDRERRSNSFKQELIEKRKNCQHNWRYDGHSHNDDCYVCTICGETGWR